MTTGCDDRHVCGVISIMLLCAFGCGARAALVPVSGRVEVDGKPLTSGGILVVPDEGRAASGVLGPNGQFTLSTFREGDGVVRGRHKVEVVAIERIAKNRQRWLVPKHVRSAASSQVFLDVTGPTQDVVLRIETAGEKLEAETVLGE